MTEHAAVIFVFFFLAEYASIVLICILNTLLFLGGYLLDYTFINNIIDYTDYEHSLVASGYYNSIKENSLLIYLMEGVIYGLILGFKACLMIFTFI